MKKKKRRKAVLMEVLILIGNEEICRVWVSRRERGGADMGLTSNKYYSMGRDPKQVISRLFIRENT